MINHILDHRFTVKQTLRKFALGVASVFASGVIAGAALVSTEHNGSNRLGVYATGLPCMAKPTLTESEARPTSQAVTVNHSGYGIDDSDQEALDKLIATLPK